MGESTSPQPELDMDAVEELRRRLGPVDELKMRKFLQIPAVERIRMMMEKSAEVLSACRAKLRAAHPEVDDLTLTRMVHDELSDKIIYFWPPDSTE
jgi:hypothetical protein